MTATRHALETYRKVRSWKPLETKFVVYITVEFYRELKAENAFDAGSDTLFGWLYYLVSDATHARCAVFAL